MIVIVADDARHKEWLRELDEQARHERDVNTILSVILAEDVETERKKES